MIPTLMFQELKATLPVSLVTIYLFILLIFMGGCPNNSGGHCRSVNCGKWEQRHRGSVVKNDEEEVLFDLCRT